MGRSDISQQQTVLFYYELTSADVPDEFVLTEFGVNRVREKKSGIEINRIKTLCAL